MTVKLSVNRRIAGLAAVSALAVTLAACGGDATTTTTTADAATGDTETTSDAETTSETTSDAGGDPYANLSGSIAGAGASSMEKAQNAWLAEFNALSGVNVSYDAVGSGGGREQFIAGTTLFAGSDSALKADEITSATDRCFGATPIELPLYVSPIAVIFNLEGIDSLNMSADTIAGIFAGEITKWNDPAIADANPDVELPDLDIVPVNRADKSGTTDNFTDYLEKAAPDVWPYEASDIWPIEGTQSGDQTSGLISVVEGANGTIGYADASRAGDLGTVAVGVGDEFVPYSPEAAAKIIEVSTPAETATDTLLAYDLARDTTEAGTYPIVLVAYTIACSQYDNEEDAANVRAYLTYIASEEGQAVAAQPDVAGSAPISDGLREQVMTIVDAISAN